MKYSKIVILSILLIVSILFLTPFFIDFNNTNNNQIFNTGKLSVEKTEDKNIVAYNYKNEKGKLIYSWTFDKNKIENHEKINLDMDFESEILSKVINIEDNMKILSFDHEGLLPNNTRVKVYVGDKFNENDKINIYYFDEDIEILKYKKSYTVDNMGYVEINLEHCSDYLLTVNIIETAVNNPAHMSFVIFVLLAFIILLIGVSLFSSNGK